MTHLGSLSSALADGQLAPAAAERALAHVAVCPLCAAELDEARRARRAIASAMDVVPTPELSARLLALAAESHGATGGPPGAAHRTVRLGESARAGGAPLLGDVTRRHLGPRIALGSLAGAGAVAAMLYAMGAQPLVAPELHPARALSALGQAKDAGAATSLASGGTSNGAADLDARIVAAWSTPASSQGAQPGDEAVLEWMGAHHWSTPASLPADLAVTAVRALDVGTGRSKGLEVDLANSQGRAVVTEHRGRLDTTVLGDASAVQLGDATIYVLSSEPWRAVWQSGDSVVEVVTDLPQADVVELVAHFPADRSEIDLPARLARGWWTVTGGLDQ